jgi:hypothetical protein
MCSYAEAKPILYQTNTFVFWDLRTIKVLRDKLRPDSFAAIRSIDLFLMCYRKDDSAWPFTARNFLQMEAWPSTCNILSKLPGIRNLRIFVANPVHFTHDLGVVDRAEQLESLVTFLACCNRIQTYSPFELYFPQRWKRSHENQHWNLRALSAREISTVEARLKTAGVDCKAFTSHLLTSEGDLMQKRRRVHLLDVERDNRD